MWNAMISQGKIVTGRSMIGAPPIAPHVTAVCQELQPVNLDIQRTLFRQTVAKANDVFNKLEFDTRDRLAVQLRIFETCRMFNFVFIAHLPIAAFLRELDYRLEVIPRIAHLKQLLIAGAVNYQERALIAVNNIPLRTNPLDASQYW